MPEDLRDNLSHTYLMSPVAGLESLVRDNDSNTLSEPWNPGIVAHLGRNIYENMSCMQAWKVIPKSAIIAALDTIRTRILNFVLEVEGEAPEAGEAPPNTNPLPQERVQHIFNTYISGNVQNVANASPGTHQQATYNEQNPEFFRLLLDAIENAVINPRVKATTIESVNNMARATSQRNFREAYRGFVSVLADHAQVLGVVLAPFLPQLASMLNS